MNDLLKVHSDADRIDVTIQWGDGSVKRHVLVKCDGWQDFKGMRYSPVSDPRTYKWGGDLPEFGKAIRIRRDPTALIGFLAAKLACHAPDDSAVKWAMEWLDAGRK